MVKPKNSMKPKENIVLLDTPMISLFLQEPEKTSKKYLKFSKTTFPIEDWYLQEIKLKLHTFLKDLIF